LRPLGGFIVLDEGDGIQRSVKIDTVYFAPDGFSGHCACRVELVCLDQSFGKNGVGVPVIGSQRDAAPSVFDGKVRMAQNQIDLGQIDPRAGLLWIKLRKLLSNVELSQQIAGHVVVIFRDDLESEEVVGLVAKIVGPGHV
ncbi:MAG: hypothetical protein M3O31_14195, partial [Acidobacteriota bacterium]|nr:hypothetical protein [Acidobacteriota bacterium]